MMNGIGSSFMKKRLIRMPTIPRIRMLAERRDQETIVADCANRAADTKVSTASRAVQGTVDDLLRRVRDDPAFDPGDELILESAPPAAAATRGRSGTARVLWWRPDALEAETVSEAAGYLLVAEGYAPGWSAAVDGRPVGQVRWGFVKQGGQWRVKDAPLP